MRASQVLMGIGSLVTAILRVGPMQTLLRKSKQTLYRALVSLLHWLGFSAQQPSHEELNTGHDGNDVTTENVVASILSILKRFIVGT